MSLAKVEESGEEREIVRRDGGQLRVLTMR